MKQGQLSNFFKKLTLVPESSNGDERVQPGATVETRASPPKHKQPAALPKVLYMLAHLLSGTMAFMTSLREPESFKTIGWISTTILDMTRRQT